MKNASRLGITQVVAYTGTSAGATNAFGSQTYRIRVVANSACHIKIGDGTQTSVVTEAFIPANWPEYFTVTPGQKVAFIQAATGGLVTGTAGSAWVTELS